MAAAVDHLCRRHNRREPSMNVIQRSFWTGTSQHEATWWTLRKDARVATCEMFSHPFGHELRLELASELLQSRYAAAMKTSSAARTTGAKASRAGAGRGHERRAAAQHRPPAVLLAKHHITEGSPVPLRILRDAGAHDQGLRGTRSAARLGRQQPGSRRNSNLPFLQPTDDLSARRTAASSTKAGVRQWRGARARTGQCGL